MANIPDRTLAEQAGQLNVWRFMPPKAEGFAKAEVTVGGIETRIFVEDDGGSQCERLYA